MSSAWSVRAAIRRRGVACIAGAGALLLAISGCSSPGPADLPVQDGSEQQAVMSSVLKQLESMNVDPDNSDVQEGYSGDGESPDDAPAVPQQDVPSIVRWLPAAPTGDPAGWQRSPVECLDRAEAIGSSYVGFAVPGDWELGGRTGGSGSPTSMSFDYGFRPTDLGAVKISIHSDSHDLDGVLQKEYDGQPDSESTFDYDYTVGDDTVRIIFDAVGDVPVGDSTTQLYVARPEQAPDRLDDVVYKARINQFDMPQPMFDGTWRLLPHTFVIEISYQPDEGDVSEETVKAIVSSLVMPECSVTHAMVLAELTTQRDIDGDGRVSDQQDYMDVLQAGS